MLDKNIRELTLTRELNASRELVFKAWTEPGIIAKWWGPNGVTIPVCQFDARPNGLINIVMLAGDELGEMKGSRWPMTGMVKEIVEPEKLVYISNAIINGKPILETRTTVTLSGINNQTKMVVHILVTKTTPEAEGPLSGMEMGWNQQLDKLVNLMTKT